MPESEPIPTVNETHDPAVLRAAATPPLLDFNPSPTDERAIIELLLSPDHSLTAIAARFSTTIGSLVLWMSLPRIAERLDASNTALAFRARLAASSCLPSVITALDKVLSNFNREPAPVSAELALRRNEAARRAGALLVRICHFRPLPANTTAPQRAATTPPFPDGRGRGKGDDRARQLTAHDTAVPIPKAPHAAHSASSSLGHAATSPAPAASLLQSEGLAVRSRGVEGGASPTDTPGKPPFQSQSEGLLVAPAPRPAQQLATNSGNDTPFQIPDRSSFPDDDAYLNHLAQLVGIDPADFDKSDNTELSESLLANTS